jgi:integrase
MRVKDRYGKVRFYHRKTGERLPDDQGERVLRLLEINRTLPAKGAPKRTARGTFADVIRRYKASADFTKLAPKTRREYGRHLDAIEAKLGEFMVRDLRRAHVKTMRDQLQETPREANYRLSILHRLLAYAIDDELIKENVATNVKRLDKAKDSGYRAWPANVYQQAVAHADKELADYFRLLSYTGQRPQDVIAMTWAQVDRGEGYIAIRQQKTDEPVWVPLHPGLIAALDEIPKRAPQILTRASGRPWTSVNELARRTRAVMEAIGQEGQGYTPHGLRHAAGDALAEAGCSDAQIMAVLGHSTERMARTYTRTASRKRLAKSAQIKRFGGE